MILYHIMADTNESDERGGPGNPKNLSWAYP